MGPPHPPGGGLGQEPAPALKGELDAYWAFSIDDDLRVLFRWEGDEAFLVHLGSHDEVY